jgi:hypothetical protein
MPGRERVTFFFVVVEDALTNNNVSHNTGETI